VSKQQQKTLRMWDGEENAEQHKPCWREIWHPKPWCPPIFLKKIGRGLLFIKKKIHHNSYKASNHGNKPSNKRTETAYYPKSREKRKIEKATATTD
jgi:hypothetical protein